MQPSFEDRTGFATSLGRDELRFLAELGELQLLLSDLLGNELRGGLVHVIRDVIASTRQLLTRCEEAADHREELPEHLAHTVLQ